MITGLREKRETETEKGDETWLGFRYKDAETLKRFIWLKTLVGFVSSLFTTWRWNSPMHLPRNLHHL